MKILLAVVAVVLILGGWYWYSISSSMSAKSDQMTEEASQMMGTNDSPDQGNMGEMVHPLLTVANDADLGDYLVASNGMTLYLYTKDSEGVSNCSGQCAINWPPYVATGMEPLLVGEGIVGALATIDREDGTMQLTYNGAPLYFWKDDKNPGETTGQNVGGVWFVVKP